MLVCQSHFNHPLQKAVRKKKVIKRLASPASFTKFKSFIKKIQAYKLLHTHKINIWYYLFLYLKAQIRILLLWKSRSNRDQQSHLGSKWWYCSTFLKAVNLGPYTKAKILALLEALKFTSVSSVDSYGRGTLSHNSFLGG